MQLRILLIAITITLLTLGIYTEVSKRRPAVTATGSPILEAPDADDTLGKWRLVWLAREGQPGRNPKKTTGEIIVSFTKYTTKEVQLHSVYSGKIDHVFNWDKVSSPDAGEWSSDNPKDAGRFYLERVNKYRFKGWQTDITGDTADMWLYKIN
jgi:hypothetical protein